MKIAYYFERWMILAREIFGNKVEISGEHAILSVSRDKADEFIKGLENMPIPNDVKERIKIKVIE